MDIPVRLYRALLVSQPGKLATSLTSLLAESGFSPVTVENSAAGARRQFTESDYDIAIVNTPLPDEFGTKLALDLVGDSTAGILLLVKEEHFSDIHSRVGAFGVLTLPKPTSAAAVSQALTLLTATRERLRRFEQKTATIEEKMQEIRLVNQAKWLLIENLKMTEAEAHRYIEKTAMDRCLTRREIAQSIIKTYR